ncbi:hexokinase-domain-containing protein [Circinella umbellata]|nr:hexokinase-domain-containing protein [Circinella umbellata]
MGNPTIPFEKLKYVNEQQQLALEELHRQFCLDRETLEQVINEFDNELKAGLLDDRSSDLNMIPSFVTGYPTGQEKGTYLALEIIGMDIYACQVKLKGEGGKLAINQYQYKIPQDLMSGDDFVVLIDYVVECVSDFLGRVGTQDLFVYPMACSLCFAIKQTALNNGRILSLGHGFSYPNGVGVDIVQLMHERMQIKGLPIKVVAITNDAVCVLLAHAYQHSSTRLGIVHSLGTNCAYYEPVSHVTKLQDPSFQHNDRQSMIINTEWCNFGSSRRTLPCTWFDRKLDRESINPQYHVFEKMTTGIALGELVRNILIYLVDRDVLFGGESSETLNRQHGFDTSYMYVCEADDSEDLEDTRIVIEDMLHLSKSSLGDREIVRRVCQFVGMRASTLVGAAIAAIVKHMVEHGIGFSEEEGYSICKFFFFLV